MENENLTTKDGEKTFPIYSMSAMWIEDGKHEDTYEHNRKGLPEGRIRNSIIIQNLGFKEDPSNDELNKWGTDWWEEYKEKNLDKNPSDTITIIKLVEREVWWLTWFQHVTFDLGQSDQEVLQSFGRFVDRKEQINRREGKMVDGFWQEPYCLMGAEDRYRWSGAEPDGDNNSCSDPPCRCKYCKEQGVIRIGH